MASNAVCENGHPLARGAVYCGTCGKPGIEEPRGTDAPRISSTSGWISRAANRRLFIGLIGVAVAIATLVLFLGRGETLVVWIAPQGNDYPCDGGAYTIANQQYAGSSVTVLDADRSPVGHGRVESGPVEEAGHCGWKASVSGVDASEWYTVQIDLANGFSDELQFSRAEIEAQDWNVGIKVPMERLY